MRRRIAVLVFILALCASGIVFLQSDLRRVTGPMWHRESMTYLPKGDRLKNAFLGFETTVAHYLWIRTVLYFGEHLKGDGRHVWLVDMLDNITRLCPWFYPAYEFAGLMVPDYCSNPEAARILLERGLAYAGEKTWNLYFYLGTIHLKYYRDRRMAADFITHAALVESPHKMKLVSMANAFYRQVGAEEEGLAFLVFTYETSANPEVRRHIAEKIREHQKKALP